jgi:hypothetical protein
VAATRDGEFYEDVPALSDAQLARWDSLVKELRSNPTELQLRKALSAARRVVPEPWSYQLRADCYRARISDEGLSPAAACLYAAARQWGSPRPLNHKRAMRLVRP